MNGWFTIIEVIKREILVFIINQFNSMNDNITLNTNSTIEKDYTLK